MTVVQDMLGNDILPGDTVAYPTGASSSIAMNVGEVVETIVKDHPYQSGKQTIKIKVRKTFTARYRCQAITSGSHSLVEMYTRMIVLKRADGSAP